MNYTSLYYQPNELDLHVTNQSSALNIFHMNLRSVVKNFDELKIFLSRIKMKFAVIVITETWLDDESDWPCCDGYTAYHTIRKMFKEDRWCYRIN